jgi:hypothetical protein
MPAEKTENKLREDAKEKGKQADEAKAEANKGAAKLTAVRTMLSNAADPTSTPQATGFAKSLSGTKPANDEALKVTVAQALNVIDS